MVFVDQLLWAELLRRPLRPLLPHYLKVGDMRFGAPAGGPDGERVVVPVEVEPSGAVRVDGVLVLPVGRLALVGDGIGDDDAAVDF